MKLENSKETSDAQVAKKHERKIKSRILKYNYRNRREYQILNATQPGKMTSQRFLQAIGESTVGPYYNLINCKNDKDEIRKFKREY